MIQFRNRKVGRHSFPQSFQRKPSIPLLYNNVALKIFNKIESAVA